MNKKDDQSLPSVDSVLNKLKSDGTFDQFRRTCLGHIQDEPSFRAYSEHMEVVSRRYLQSYKWKENSTKNEVRGKLKDHALGVIVSPDIQVGTPLIEIVEKMLESKAKELLPKISNAVAFLCETKSKQLKKADPKKETIPQSSSDNPAVELPKSDFVDLSLPIDIPGLRTPAGGATSGKKDSQGVSSSVKKETQGVSGTVKKEGQVGADSKQNKVKPKAVGDVTKDPNKAGTKIKTTSAVKSLGKDSGKVKGEIKEPSMVITDKEGEKSIKEKEKPKFTRIPKKQKQDGEPPKETDKESNSEAKTNTKSQLAVKDSKNTTEELETPNKRRSARIASQTGSRDSSENEDESDKEFEASLSNPVNRKRNRTPTKTTSKKKAKIMISSSSEESDDEVSSGGYESDTDQESEKPTKRKQKRKRKFHNENEQELIKKHKVFHDETTLTAADPSTPNKRKSNPPQRITLRASKSPPVVVTRYNRSVKPNRKYYDVSPDDDNPDETLTDQNWASQGEEVTQTKVKPLSLDTTRPCDIGVEMEIDRGALLTEKDDFIYEMITPKPTLLKIRKTLVKGVRSRKKTKTRISFFYHR